VIVTYCDGRLAKNGGIFYGCVVYLGGEKVAETCGVYRDRCPRDSNAAEFAAVISGLRFLVTLGFTGEVEIRNDNNGCVETLHRFRPHNPPMSHLDLMLRAVGREFLEAVQYFSRITYRWVPREENTEADALALRAYLEEFRRQVLERRKLKKIQGG